MELIKSKNQLDDITAKKAFDQAFANLQKHFREGVFIFAANDGLAKNNIDQPQLLIAAMVAQDTAAVNRYDHKGKQLYHFFKSITNLMDINRAEWVGKRTEKEKQVAHKNYLKSAHGRSDNPFDYETFCQKLGLYPGTMVDFFE